jgi:hypothetical protein
VLIQLDAAEAQVLLALLRSGDASRLREIHRTESPEFRDRLERDARRIQALEEKLEAAVARGVDESGVQSFPASDPPAW